MPSQPVCVNCATHSLGFITLSFLPELFSKPKADGFASPCTRGYTIPARLTCQVERHEQPHLPAHPPPSSASATPHLPIFFLFSEQQKDPIVSDQTCVFIAWLPGTLSNMYQTIFGLETKSPDPRERLVPCRELNLEGDASPVLRFEPAAVSPSYTELTPKENTCIPFCTRKFVSPL